MSENGQLDRDDVLVLLHALEAEAANADVKIELFVVGGGAMVLAYNLDRTTGDVDAVFEPKRIVYQLAERVAAESDKAIVADWLNDGVKGFLPGDDPNATVFLDRPHLTVSVASPRYMFVLKAMSARESDEDDLRILYPLCEFGSIDEALSAVEAAYPTRPIKAAVRYMIEGVAAQAGPTVESRAPAADRDHGARHHVDE